MSLVWERYPTGGVGLLVALKLADISDDDGRVIYGDTSIRRLAVATRATERHVQRILREMEQAGLLHREERPGGASIYHLDLPSILAGSPPEVRRRDRGGRHEVAPSHAPQGRHEVATGGDLRSPGGRHDVAEGATPRSPHIHKTISTTHTPPAEAGAGGVGAVSGCGGKEITVPRCLAHAEERARALLRRARPEDRAAVAAQVDREARSNPVGFLLRLVDLSAAGEYVPPPPTAPGGGGAVVGLPADPLADVRRQRRELAGEVAQLDELAAAGGPAGAQLTAQADAGRAKLAELDRQLAAGARQ